MSSQVVSNSESVLDFQKIGKIGSQTLKRSQPKQVVYLAEALVAQSEGDQEHLVIYHKIGISKHPLQRADQLSVPGILDLKIIHTIPIMFARKAEKILHDSLKEYRVSPEWFKLPGDLIDTVRECEGEHDLLQFCGVFGD